jgi:hypothetical protein
MRTAHLIALMVASCAFVTAWMLVAGTGSERAAGFERRALLAPAEVPLERVNRIELARPGAPALVFERNADGWRQTAPFEHPGDARLLREVLDTAASLEETRAVRVEDLDAHGRAALGLEPPQAVLTLAWPGGERALELGRRTVAGRAWVRVRGRPTAGSVDAALHALAVEGDPRQWRSMALYDAAPGDAARIRMRVGAGTDAEWTLEREGGRWRFVAPVRTRADDEAVRAYVEAIARAEADAVAADQPGDLAPFGLGQPARSVRVERVGGAPPALVEIGNPVVQGAPERFGRVDGRPVVLQVGAKALAALLPPPAFFVDPRGSDALPADVRVVAFAPAPGTSVRPFELERARDAWVLRAGGGDAVPASGEAVRRLLAQLTEARAGAVAFNALPADLLLGVFTLRGEGGRELARIRVAREQGGRWALDNGEDVLRVFPEGFDVRVDASAYATAP